MCQEKAFRENYLKELGEIETALVEKWEKLASIQKKSSEQIYKHIEELKTSVSEVNETYKIREQKLTATSNVKRNQSPTTPSKRLAVSYKSKPKPANGRTELEPKQPTREQPPESSVSTQKKSSRNESVAHVSSKSSTTTGTTQALAYSTRTKTNATSTVATTLTSSNVPKNPRAPSAARNLLNISIKAAKGRR